MKPIVSFAIILALASCKDPSVNPKNVDTAATVAEYEVALADCRKQGKAAKSYDVYETCADALDAKECSTKGLRCKDGGAK